MNTDHGDSAPGTDATLRTLLCELGNRIVGLGLSTGTSGSISARTDPPRPAEPPEPAPLPRFRLDGARARTLRERGTTGRGALWAAPAPPSPAGDRILISPHGVPLERLTADALAEVTVTGQHLTGPRPSVEVSLHTAMLNRFPDARVVIHLHSPYATAASCLESWSANSALPPLTPSLLMRVGRVPRAPYATPPDLDGCLDTVAGDFRAVLLANHGSLAWGTTADAALDAAIEVEEASRTYLLLHGAQAVTTLSDAEARDLAAAYGTPW